MFFLFFFIFVSNFLPFFAFLGNVKLRAGPGWARLGRAGLGRAGPGRAGLGRAGPGWGGPGWAEPGPAGPGLFLYFWKMQFCIFEKCKIRQKIKTK